MISGNSARDDLSDFLSGSEEKPKPKPKGARLSKPPPPDASSEFKEIIEESNKRDAKRRSKTTLSASAFNRSIQDVEEMIASGDWSQCTARHLVALYDMMHVKCYGIEPAELGPKERYRAVLMAANLVKHEFDGKISGMIAYMRWIWTREISRERWRRENNRDSTFRIGFYQMFTPSGLLTDYRLALARKHT